MLSRQTPQVNAPVAEIISQTSDLPRGVVTVFTGGHEAGDALVTSPDVPAIRFTSSSQTGRTIFAHAAPHPHGLEPGPRRSRAGLRKPLHKHQP